MEDMGPEGVQNGQHVKIEPMVLLQKLFLFTSATIRYEFTP
jgi:hypothetical protein